MSFFLLLCGLQRSFAASCVLLALVGYFSITMTTQTNATLQLRSDDRFRGRVMSVFSLVFGGVTPVGAMYAGALIDATSAAVCMVVSGAIGLAATWFIFRKARKAGAGPGA